MKRKRKLVDDLILYLSIGLKAHKLYRDEKTIAAFYLRNLKKPYDLAFDVGANQGVYAKILSTLYREVVCFEPQPMMVEKIKEKAKNSPNLRVIEKAISDREGTAKIYLSRQNEMSSMEKKWIQQMRESGRFGNNEWSEERAISTITLDAAIRRYGVPNFLKVDVEGHEYKVFSTLSHPVKNIVFECTPEARDAGISSIEKISENGKYVFFFAKNGLLPTTVQRRLRMTACEIKKIISSKEFQSPDYFDVYAKLAEPND